MQLSKPKLTLALLLSALTITGCCHPVVIQEPLPAVTKAMMAPPANQPLLDALQQSNKTAP